MYSRYANPLEFMRLYINDERFGEFVTEVIEMDIRRKQEAADKENDDKLFNMYVHSMPDKSFNDWKASVLNSAPQEANHQQNSYAMTDAQVNKQLEKSRNILKRFKVN